MTMFEYIAHSPATLASWILSNKEAVDLPDDMYIGVSTQTLLGQHCESDDGKDHYIDATDTPPEVLEELHGALVMMLNTEVDENGNPIQRWGRSDDKD